MSLYFERSYQRAFGTFPLRGEELRTAVRDAIATGYRAFDTAQMYGNEAELGEALADSGVGRDELCITTKVHPDNFGEDRFMRSVEASLDALRVDRVDALLLHWPMPGGDNRGPLELLQQARRRGLAAHIGVSNFTAGMMREAVARLDEPLVANQVEFHPLLDQSVLLRAAAETGVPLSSFCSVARGEVFRYPVFGEIAAEYGRTPAQIVLRWILQKGVPITTMSTKPQNIRANFEVMDFVLSSIDMARIDALAATNHRCVDSSKVPWAPDWD
ncbi:aldo/keto reductase [Labrys monachus]|uniref:2,5-diketo-D-gluconate reductase B n=1 Tax=Labrys monachus TaxID=217067 RepID=A0ABU0F8Q3_9HYPH|nr:aldo/keto reductase [Labrys monachus]MDQ0391000.1 2,5-diketo-D-gluconate reductase B [Labrys monachus]